MDCVFSTGDPNLAALKAEQAAAANASSNSSDPGSSHAQEETTPRGLNNWREATARAHTSAQLAMALYMLEASIAWDKSIMKAVSLTTARKSVCVKLRNRSVSLKATTQYKQLMSTTQASVGIRTNLLTESSYASYLYLCLFFTSRRKIKCLLHPVHCLFKNGVFRTCKLVSEYSIYSIGNSLFFIKQFANLT